MYKCKYDHIGFKTFACMYTVASLEECIEKILLFKVVITCCMKSAWGTLCICALAKKKKCLNKSGQFKTQQYSTSGHDFCCGILAL